MTENDRLTVKNKMWNGVEIYELKDSCPNVYGIQRLGEYEEVGTVEECRTAVERMKPKKPVVKYGCTYRCPPDCGGEEFDEYGDVYHCPNCDRELSYSLDDVCRCGQAIDWRK